MDRYLVHTSFNVIEIHKEVIETLLAHKQLSDLDLESGGIITGKIYNNKDWEINFATRPSEADHRERQFFRRSCDHQNILKDLWAQSGKTTTLLGTWHTHPESYPHPSVIDLEDWRNILKKAVYHSGHLLFVIVGIEVIRFWIGSHQDNIYFLDERNV